MLKSPLMYMRSSFGNPYDVKVTGYNCYLRSSLTSAMVHNNVSSSNREQSLKAINMRSTSKLPEPKYSNC